MFYVYLLQSIKDNKLYSGFAPDIRKRLRKHNEGRVSSTKHRRPLKLIYCEVCTHKQDALQREKNLKTGAGKKFIKYRLKNYFQGQSQ